MKHIYSVVGLCALAVSVVYFAQCKDAKTASPNTETPSVVASGDNLTTLPIAYVDVDSLLSNLQFYNKMVSQYEEKLLKYNTSMKANYDKLQSEAAMFQQKVQNNAFLTKERYNQEQTRLQRMQEDLQNKAAQIDKDMAVEQRLIEQQLSDSLNLGIKEFNTPQKYQVILTKTGNSTILYADEKYNITQEVLDFLNKRFK